MVKGFALSSLVLVVVACASIEANSKPATLRKGGAAGSETIVIPRQIWLDLPGSLGVTALRSGSHWSNVGEIDAGTVYRPDDQVLMVETVNMHEAWLVVDAGSAVGLYLPYEKRFICSKKPVDIH